MVAIYNNLFLEQGATYNTNINISGSYDLVGNGSSQLRQSYYSSNSSGSFTVTVDEANSKINLFMASDLTANIAAGRYVYDVILNNSSANTITRILEGVVYVSPSVTR